MPNKAVGVKAISKKLESKRKETVKAICEMYGDGEYTIEVCCQANNISVPTWYRWCDEEEWIATAFMGAKQKKEESFVDNLRKRALTSLQERVSGKTITEIHQEGYWEESKTEFNSDGSPKRTFIVTKTRQVRKEIQPSDTAIIFVLTNTMPDKFKRNGGNAEGGEGGDEPNEGRVRMRLPDGTEIEL